MLGSYVGPPNTDDNGNLDSDFFVITHSPEWQNNGGTSDYRYLSGRAWMYDYNSGGAVTQSADWFIDKADGAAHQEVWPDQGYNVGAATSMSDYPPYSRNLPILPYNSTGGFLASKMETSNYLFAAISFWTVPDQIFNQADWDDIEHSLPKRFFRQGSLVKGYDVNSDDPGTLGRILHYTDRVATGPTDEDSMGYNTSRCLFQTTFPKGVYLEDETSYKGLRQYTWNGANYFKYKINMRNMTGGSTNVNLLPAMVVSTTGNTGQAVKMTTARDSNTWTWTETSVAPNQLITFADGSPNTGLSCKPDWDEVLVEIKTGTAASTLAVRTISLWETTQII
jgi:hypothetical protein